MRAKLKFFNNLESWYKYRYLYRKHGVALLFVTIINTKRCSQGFNIKHSIIYSIIIVISSNSSYYQELGMYWVRENVILSSNSSYMDYYFGLKSPVRENVRLYN